jgi:hypothetical protein
MRSPRIGRRESKAIDAALDKHDPQSFRQWFGGWEQQHRTHIAEVMQPVAAAAAAAGIVLRSDYIDQYLATTRQDIEQILTTEPEFKADARWSVISRWTGDRIDESANLIMGENGSSKTV